MPKDKDFKHLVRERMSETGERYTQAREEMLAGSWAARCRADPALSS